MRLADLFPFILIAAGASFFLVPLIIRLMHRANLIDVPGTAPHKLHDSPTPLGGGLVLYLAIAPTYLLLNPDQSSSVLGILLAGGLITLWGLWDDYRGMRPLAKLGGQLIATGILVLVGVQVRIFNQEWLNLTLTVLWIVGLTNAFNFIDSMDGLALGLAGIASGFFMLVTIDSGQPDLAALSAVILGAVIGLFYYNASPAKIFLGDSGAQLLGLMLAAIGLAYNPVGLPQGVTWFTPILVLGVPIFDTMLVVTSRLRDGRRIVEAGHDHTYHRLLGLGLDPTRSVLLMQIIAIGLGLLAFVALDATILLANVLFFSVSLLGIIALLLLGRIQISQAE